MKRKKLLKRSALKRIKRLTAKGKPRFKVGRDEAFLAWIRHHPCTIGRMGVCRWPSDAAHVRSRGAGGLDAGNVVPLCPIHHAEQHRIGIRSFEKNHGVDLKAEAERLAREYEAAR